MTARVRRTTALPTGCGTAAGEAWRTRVTYMTNLRTSYAAGRYRQLTEAGIKFWMWKHSGLAKEPRAQHLAWDGLVLPADHPFWQRHFPPQIPPHWGCRCRVVGVDSPESARALGGDPDKTLPKDWAQVDAKYKTQGPDWNYAPGANAAMSLREMVANKLFNLPAPIGAAMWGALASAMLSERSAAFGAFVDAALTGPPAGHLFVAGALKPDWVAAASKAGIPPATADIGVRDRDVAHTFRDSKAATLDLDWYRRLPEHLDTPGAVILDTTHDKGPAFLLIYGLGEGRADKLVVRVNYRIKKTGLGNIVQTGKPVDPAGIRAQIGRGYELIEGSL